MATRNPNLSARFTDAKRGGAGSEKHSNELTGPRGDWWYTGKLPTQCPGFDKDAQVLRSLPLPQLNTYTRQSVLNYFDNTWALTESLFACLQGPESFVRQPYHQLRHPMMFYYGHPAVLYINKFRVAGLLSEAVDAHFEQLFETGVDEMSWDDLSQDTLDWPFVREVHAYRQQCYAVIRKVLEEHPALDGQEAGWDAPTWAVFMSFEHERIHIETSSVLIRELPIQFVRKPEFWPEVHPSARRASVPIPQADREFPVNNLLPVDGELVVLGKHLQYPSFGWDNEYGRRQAVVPAFKASKCKVTNGEFLAFVKAGGYNNLKFWSKEGWGWKTFRNVKWPTFWVPDGPAGLHQYRLRTLFEVVSMPWDWPVDVNYHEAKAFCAWRTQVDGQVVKYRLVTEAEHMLLRNTRDRSDAYRAHKDAPLTGDDANGITDEDAAQAATNVDICMHSGGQDVVTKYGVNVQLAFGSQSPVNALPPTEKGFHDVLGNAWEWAEDHYAAYPGFKVHDYYTDFSAPCFAGEHQLILGGSFISTGQLASKYARYQFRPHFFQHASFRVVQSQPDVTLYDLAQTTPEQPIYPRFETSCINCAPPYVGEGPCCRPDGRKGEDFTPTMDEECAAAAARLTAARTNYESSPLMGQYLSLHYGPSGEAFASLTGQGGILEEALDFPRKCGEFVNKWVQAEGVASQRALDLGCAVGRSTFEMAKVFDAVVGIDISQTFVDMANKLKEEQMVDYELVVEGDVKQKLMARVDPEVDTRRVTFVQGDACNLPSDLGSFDAVLAANLLCRVPNPRVCLQQITRVLHPGGVLVMTSPFTWLPEFTDRNQWVGARVEADGNVVRSASELKELLQTDFDVLSEDHMPVLIRETVRKYQLILPHRVVLRKKCARR